MVKAQCFSGLRKISKVIVFASLLVALGLGITVEKAPASQAGGKVKVYESIEGAPQNPHVGQIYRNPEDNTNYIYNGSIWVPHDRRADEIDYEQVRKELRKAKEGRK